MVKIIVDQVVQDLSWWMDRQEQACEHFKDIITQSNPIPSVNNSSFYRARKKDRRHPNYGKLNSKNQFQTPKNTTKLNFQTLDKKAKVAVNISFQIKPNHP